MLQSVSEQSYERLVNAFESMQLQTKKVEEALVKVSEENKKLRKDLESILARKFTVIPIDGTPFDPSKQYRIWLGGAAAYYPTTVASGYLFFIPSTSGHFFGCITCTDKASWHYRIMGDCANRPKGYETQAEPVDRIEVWG